MIGSLLQNAEKIIQTNPWLAFVVVFLGGLLTALNPCVLAMIPLMIGFVGGTKEISGFKRALLFSFLFVVGLSLSFSVLGLIAAITGRLLGDVGAFWKYIIAGVCFVMSIHLLDIFKIKIPAIQINNPRLTGYLGSLLMGMLFGIVSAPCAMPILAVILVFIASKGNIVYGAGLLFFYALGHCALILVVGTSIGAAKGIMESKHLQKATFYLRKAAAVLIILVGVYFLIKK
jgi:cytochrome c biogenesis protein CcdA